MTMRCIMILAAVLAVIYAQTESESVGQSPQQTLLAPVVSPKVEATPLQLEAISDEVAETQSRNKRAPILLGKALLGGALLGAKALGVGALGAGVLGAGALGAGALGAGALAGAGLYAKHLGGGYGGGYGGYGGYGGNSYYHNYPDTHYHYHNYPSYHNYYPHYHYYSSGPSYAPSYGGYGYGCNSGCGW